MEFASSRTDQARRWLLKTRFESPPNRLSIRSIRTSWMASNVTMRRPLPRSSRLQKPKRSVSIIGTGSYVPDRVLTNDDLTKIVETSDEWIVTRTGIRERRIAADDEFTSDMATKAARAAIEQAGITPDEIDLIL